MKQFYLNYQHKHRIIFHPSYFTQVIKPIILRVKSLEKNQPVIVGISGGAASGKTTLSLVLQYLFSHTNPKAKIYAYSLDDFHYNAKDRKIRNIAWRGGPGAHNFTAMAQGLPKIVAQNFPVILPKFSKITDDYATPIVISDNPNIFIIEGLLVGMRSSKYPLYEKYISQYLDLLIYIDADPIDLKQWRFDAEDSLRAQTGGGMTKDELNNYWVSTLGPMLNTHIKPIQKNAHILIQSDHKRHYELKRNV